MVFKGVISNSTIDFGADSDTLTFSVAATSSTIIGGAGADTLIFSSGANLVNTSVSGGADGDSRTSLQEPRLLPLSLVAVAMTPSSLMTLSVLCS